MKGHRTRWVLLVVMLFCCGGHTGCSFVFDVWRPSAVEVDEESLWSGRGEEMPQCSVAPPLVDMAVATLFLGATLFYSFAAAMIYDHDLAYAENGLETSDARLKYKVRLSGVGMVPFFHHELFVSAAISGWSEYAKCRTAQEVWQEAKQERKPPASAGGGFERDMDLCPGSYTRVCPGIGQVVR